MTDKILSADALAMFAAIMREGKTPATSRRIVSPDQEMQNQFAEALAQSLQDDLDDEGYFYEADPDCASVGRPDNFKER